MKSACAEDETVSTDFGMDPGGNVTSVLVNLNFQL